MTLMTTLPRYIENNKKIMLDWASLYQRFQQAQVIQRLVEGVYEITCECQNNPASLPFNFGRNERIIYAFEDAVKDYEFQKVRNYSGRTVGTSVRVAKGVYTRAGGWKGQSRPGEERTEMGKGTLVITKANGQGLPRNSLKSSWATLMYSKKKCFGWYQSLAFQ